jgi:hypothetical protein
VADKKYKKEYGEFLKYIANEDPIIHGSDEKFAEFLGVNRTTLIAWYKNPEVDNIFKALNSGMSHRKLYQTRELLRGRDPKAYLERYEQNNNPTSNIDGLLEKLSKAFK